VGIIGLGYVGPPLAIHFGKKGFDVIGFDLDTRKIDRLLHGESCIKHVPGAPIREMIAARGTSGMDAVIIITDYSAYDFPEIVKHARLVVDTRNATRGIDAVREKIAMA